MSMQLQPGTLLLANSAGEEQWLAARRGGIGASEIAAVAGLSARRGPWDVWSAKVDGTEFEPTDVMRWGTFIEGRIIDWWARETNRHVGSGGLFRSAQRDWLLATPDAVVLEYTGDGTTQPRGVPTISATVDAKTADGYAAPDWEDGAPVEYIAQITQQMLAVGVRKAYLVVTIGGKPPVEREFELDEELAAMLISHGDALWAHVVDKTPPPIDGSARAADWLSRRYPLADPAQQRPLTREHVNIIAELVAVRRSIKMLQEVETGYENRLKEHLGEAIAGTHNGKNYITWKTITKAGYTVRETSYRELRITAAARKELRG